MSKKKSRQLGMNYSTAANRLRKMILWRFIVFTGSNRCFQCEKDIMDIDDLSIEHKISWLDSEDPIGLYFDMDNIAFSHMSCNYSAGKKWNKGNKRPHGTLSRYKDHACRCSECRQANADYEHNRRMGL